MYKLSVCTKGYNKSRLKGTTCVNLNFKKSLSVTGLLEEWERDGAREKQRQKAWEWESAREGDWDQIPLLRVRDRECERETKTKRPRERE